MDLVAQLVRASVCGTEGRGFEPHPGPFFLRSKAVQLRVERLFLFWIGSEGGPQYFFKKIQKKASPA